jgi:hypothetical protein
MRLPKLLTILVSLVALLALVASGCGGGDDETTSTAATTEAAPALTKAELISQGDAICAEVNSAVGAVSVSGAEVPEQITQVSDLYIGLVESIKNLGIPEDSAGYEEFIAAADELAAVEGEAKLATEREDTAAIGEAATKAAPILEEFASVAGDYGFEECSEGPSAPTARGAGAAPVEEGEEGGVEVAPEEVEEEAVPEEVAPEEEAAPETGGAGGGVEEAAPESGGGESGGSSGGVGPG